MGLSNSFLDRVLFDEYRCDPSSLGVYRILYATSLLVAYLPQYLWISTFPSSFFSPPLGFTVFFTGFPSAGFFLALNALLVFAVCALLVGYHTRFASASVAVLLLAGNAWAYSFGKINQDIPLVLVPLVLQFSGWGDAWSLDKIRGKAPVHPAYNSWPLALLALLMGFAMLTAAVAKAASGWLDIHTHAVLGHILRIAAVEGHFNGITAQVLRIKSGVFWELCDYSTIVLEGAFLFVVVRRRAFQVVCAVACFFHLGIASIMEIAVWSNVLAYGAFYDWSLESSPWGRKALAAWMTMLDRLSVLKLAVVSGFLFLLFITVGNPAQNLAKLLFARPEPVALWSGIVIFAAIVASIFLVSQIRSMFTVPWPSRDGRHPIILFDGVCGLCNSWVDFVLKHDTRAMYRFTPLQSDAGQELLTRLSLSADFRNSMILIEDEQAYLRSSAALRILRGLGMPFSAAYLFVVVPTVIRDYVYKVVADRRLQWFGERTTCRMPTPAERHRFL